MTANTDGSFKTEQRVNKNSTMPHILLAAAIAVLGLLCAIIAIHNDNLSQSLLVICSTAMGFAAAGMVIGLTADRQQNQRRRSYNTYIGTLKQRGGVETFYKSLYDDHNVVSSYHLTDDTEAKIDITLADNGTLIECYSDKAYIRATQVATLAISDGADWKHLHVELRKAPVTVLTD